MQEGALTSDALCDLYRINTDIMSHVEY